MFPAARLKLLQQRKQELLTTSEVQRRLIAVECAAVQRHLTWLDSILQTTRRFAPLFGLVLPLLQAWRTQRKNERSWFSRAIDALPLASRFAGMVRQFIRQ